MIRRIAAAGLVLLLPLTSAAAAAAQSTESNVTGAGTANTSLDVADLDVTGLPVDGLDVGGLTSYASNIPDTTLNALGSGKPFALATLRLPAGNEVTVRSDGTTGRPGERIDLAGIGSLTVGDLLAVVDGVKATSTVNALTGTIDAGLAGLTVSGTGASSLVDHTSATATNGAVIEDLSLDLGDLLPLDLLRQLPLGTLLDLLDELDLELPAALAGILRDVRALADDLAAVGATQDTIDDLQEELAAAGQQLGAATADLSDATDDLKEALASTACTDSGLIGDVGGIIDDAEDFLGGLVGDVISLQTDPCAELQEAADAVTDLEGTVDELNERIDELQDELDEAIALLNALLDELLDLLENLNLADLLALISGLVDGLAATELLAIDRLSVGVTTVSSATGSSASVVCDLRGLRLLGQTQANTCAALEQTLGELTALLDDLLSELPVVGTVTSAALPAGALTIRAPRLHSTADDTRDGDYFVATAGVEGLQLSVASLQLTQVVDDLVVSIRGEVDGLVAELEGLAGLTVDLSALDAALDELLGILDALPTGELVQGASTPGLDVNALNVLASSRFSAQGTAIRPVGTPAAESPSTRTLPATGGGVALALLLLMTGGGALWWVRRSSGSRGASLGP